MIKKVKHSMRDISGLVAFMSIAVILLPYMLINNLKIPTFFTSTHSFQESQVDDLADLSTIDRSVELKGSLIALAKDSFVTELNFTIATVAGTESIDLSEDALIVNYRDPKQKATNLVWQVEFQGEHNNDHLLDHGELAQLQLPLITALNTNLGPNTSFVIELETPQGALLSLPRTTPMQLESVVDLH